jgi:nitroreductase
MHYTAEAINTLMRERRSVFSQQYSGEKVRDEVIKQMLLNATWAPTHKLTQPWRFIVYTGAGIKKLAEAQADVYKKVTEKNGTYKEDKFQGLLTKPLLSSHIIVVGMKRDEKKSVPELEEIGAVFCAIENMYLTATAYGVGCYLSTGGITFFEEAKPLFRLGADDKLLGFLHVGMPAHIPPAQKRKSLEEVMEWIG